MSVQTPPHSSKAERAIVGAALLDPVCYDVAAAKFVNEDSFYADAHSVLWRHVGKWIDAHPNEQIDVIPFIEQLKGSGKDLQTVGGAAYVSGLLTEVPATPAVEQYAQIVVDYSWRRRLIDGAQQVIRSGYATDSSLADVQREAFALYDTAIGPESGEWVDIEQSAIEALQFREDLASGALKLYRCGWRPVDRMLNSNYGGGLLPRQVGLIGARTGVGKSTLTIDMIRRLLLQNNELKARIFSIEMEHETVADMMIRQMCAAFQKTRLQPGEEMHMDVWRRAQQVLRQKMAGRIQLKDNADMRAEQIIADIRRSARRGVKVFVIDHLHIVQLGCKPEHLRIRLGEFTMALKAVAKEHELIVIMPAQLNREGELGPMLMAHMAESDNIGRNIDWCLGLRRARANDARENQYDLWFMKNRRGVKPSEPVAMYAVWQFQRFEDETYRRAA